MRKETYKIKCPKHIVFGDPLYFEEYKGERLKKLVVDYEVPAKFDTARLVLEEKPFEKCPDMMHRMKTILSLTSNPCGAENKALRRISLPPTADRSGEMPHKRKNIA